MQIDRSKNAGPLGPVDRTATELPPDRTAATATTTEDPSAGTTGREPASAGDQRSDLSGRATGAADHRRVVAIDGAAAAGKTTVARLLAERLGATLFDTGVLYRATTLAALRAGVPVDDGAALAALAAGLPLAIERPSAADGRLYDVRLAGVDVTWALRETAVEERVSEVSAHPAVRAALLPLQRRIADGSAVVMVGRDVGTVVVPDARVKIFLAASLAERARRRHAELQGRGQDVSIAEVMDDLRARDAIDSGREVAPLRAAADATIISTDGREIGEVVDEAERTVNAAWERLGVARTAAAGGAGGGSP